MNEFSWSDLALYALNGREVECCASFDEWMKRNKWVTTRIAFTRVNEAEVSTIFIATDIRWKQPPELFETMIFGGPYNHCTWKYTTYDAAEEGHNLIVKALTEGVEP